MKYGELASLIKNDIDNGIYRETGKLPTEEMLMQKYGVTRYCVRNAIDILVGMGQVIPIQGSGMFLRENKRSNYISINVTKGLFEEFKDKNLTTKLISFQLTVADLRLADRMECKIGTPLYHIKRLRIVDGEHLCVEESYYNKDMIFGITPKVAERSIYHYIKDELGLNIRFTDEVIYCEKLDDENSQLLKLNKDSPALIVVNDAYLSNGQKFAVYKSYFNYKITKLFHLSTMK